MATITTFTFLKSTPCSVVYRLEGGTDAGPGTAGTRDFDPTMKAEMVAGPLKSELARRNGVLDQLNLNVNSARVRIYKVTGLDVVQAIPASVTLAWTTTGLTATLPTIAEGVTDKLFIEIRFEHSVKR
jgi:hypothetical protein